MDRVKRIWYLSPIRAAKVQASLRICAVSPEPLLLTHTSSESSGIFRQKARSLALLNGWACAVTICHDGMLEDKNSLDGAHMLLFQHFKISFFCRWEGGLKYYLAATPGRQEYWLFQGGTSVVVLYCYLFLLSNIYTLVHLLSWVTYSS